MLGTVDELPTDYRNRLNQLNVLPAWTKLRNVMPIGMPERQARTMHWRYRDLKVALLRASELVPIEKAERRVLALHNAGLPPDRLATMPSFFFGLQLILPGERAPNHRHVPAASRIVIEGAGAYTTVDDEKIQMTPGDLILTPPHTWHDHGNEGTGPVIWMDILDHPLAVPLDISCVIPGELVDRSNSIPDGSETYYRCAGLVPYRLPGEKGPRYPLHRFPWKRVREALDAVGQVAAKDEPVHLRYANPETGESVLKTLNFSARMIRAAELIEIAPSSINCGFQIVSGRGEAEVNGATYEFEDNDTIVAPTYASVRIRSNASNPVYLIQVDDLPTQEKLGFYDVRSARL